MCRFKTLGIFSNPISISDIFYTFTTRSDLLMETCIGGRKGEFLSSDSAVPVLKLPRTIPFFLV